MRKSFFLVLVFFVILFVLLLGTAFFAMLAENCMHMKVGIQSGFFNGVYFLNSLVRYLPWCAIISLMMLIMYIIKHKFTVPQFIIPYFVMALLLWMLVIPGCSLLYDKVQKNLPILPSDSQELSSGYFRKDGEYLTFVTGKEEDDGDIWRRKVFTDRSVEEPSNLFADSLIENIATMPVWWSFAHEKCLLLKEVCRSALADGYFSYILFATMGFALSSVIFLCRFSTWRLINGLGVIIMSAAIIIANVCFYDPPIIEKVAFLGKWWLPLVFNITVCVLFMTIGIINWVHHPDQNREAR